MSTMVAIVFDDESSAFEMRGALVKMQNQFLLDMDDAVVVTRDDKGKIKLHQPVSLTATGAVGGGFWGCSSACSFSIRCSAPRSARALAPWPANSARLGSTTG